MFLQKNLDACKQHRPELYNRIVATPRTNRFQSVPSAHAQKIPNFVDNLHKQLYYDNSDPIGRCEKDIIDKKINLPDFALFLGFGMGYHLLAYNKIFDKHPLNMVVVEPNPEVLYIAFERVDYTAFIAAPSVEWIVGVPENELFPALYTVLSKGNRKFYAKAMQVIELPAAYASNKEYYALFFKNLKETIVEILMHFGNDPDDSLIGIENTFYNINEIIDNPGINQLKGAFKGRPGIVVATGPSLDKNIHLLEKVQGKAIIAAADASLRVMKKHGFKPHFVTSLERVIQTSRLFEDLEKEDFDDVFFSACPVVRPETYENFKGERIIVYRNFATFQWLELEKGILDIGPSAGNMAYNILEYMGCDPIILIGQDLAFGDDNKSHAQGSRYGERQDHEYKRARMEVPGNVKPVVATNEIWYRFLKFYERDLARKICTVINATEGGARIPGSLVMPFLEAIEKYVAPVSQELDVPAVVRETLHVPTPEERSRERARMIQKVETALSFIKKTLQRYDTALHYSIDYEKKVVVPFMNKESFDQNVANDLFMKINDAMKVLSEPDFYLILMHYVQSYVIKSVIEINAMKSVTPPGVEQDIKTILMVRDMTKVMFGLVKNMEMRMEKMLELLVSATK